MQVCSGKVSLVALLISIFLFSTVFQTNAQNVDSLNINKNIKIHDSQGLKPHSPHKATLYSAVLPGLGQAYNKKYWKTGAVWAGFGIFGYFIVTNNNEYKSFRDAYLYVSKGEQGDPPNDLVDRYTEDQLLAQKDYYQRNLELSVIFSVLWYIVNIVDAAVDAHLYDFNVDDNLSIGIGPAQTPMNYNVLPGPDLKTYSGLTLKIKL